MTKHCFHCKDPINEEEVIANGHSFCCNGCSSVYQLLNNDDFQSFVCDLDLENQRTEGTYFDELLNPEIEKNFIKFKDKTISLVQFYIPSIHCSSCVWLFEKLPEIDPRIVDAQVNFEARSVYIKFYHDSISTHQLAVFLRKMGYSPDLSSQGTIDYKTNRTEILKLGIAGFCFGNIMLFSVPDYLTIDSIPESFQKYFGIISAILALPLVFYSGKTYFDKAIGSLKMKKVDINVPIALGIVIIYLFSLYDILVQGESGFYDSLAGLIFFLLLGQFFQNKLFEQFKMERDLKSFFPLAVLKKTENEWISTSVEDLSIGDHIKIRNNEIVPTDSLLIEGNAKLDNSFITGESVIQNKEIGETLYSGSKQIGGSIVVEVTKKFEQGTWNQIWENSNKKEKEVLLIDKIATHFTWIVLSIASIGFVYWLQEGWYPAIKVFSTVLIIACPCALALSTPITVGNLLRLLGRKGVFIKNIDVVNRMVNIKNVVFDKTGTLTYSQYEHLKVELDRLNFKTRQLINSLANQSAHPYSEILVKSINLPQSELFEPDSITEQTGKGIEGIFGSNTVYIGSVDWMKELNKSDTPIYQTGVSPLSLSGLAIAINDEIIGIYEIKQPIRSGMSKSLEVISKLYKTYILSGDSKKHMEEFMLNTPDNIEAFAEQSPMDKVDFINELNGKTLMVGDGLNDAGALINADVGLAVNEHRHAYFPTCDGLIQGNSLNELPQVFQLTKWSKTVVIICIVFSFLYNSVGLFFALQQDLTPFVAAILMPLSSISILLLSTGLMKWKFYRIDS